MILLKRRFDVLFCNSIAKERTKTNCLLVIQAASLFLLPLIFVIAARKNKTEVLL